uniref:Uncharacterized protein n=1 Tax=Trichuris muris TaxID=70415 RepID=A0A5S6QFP9_TRIMR
MSQLTGCFVCSSVIAHNSTFILYQKLASSLALTLLHSESTTLLQRQSLPTGILFRSSECTLWVRGGENFGVTPHQTIRSFKRDGIIKSPGLTAFPACRSVGSTVTVNPLSSVSFLTIMSCLLTISPYVKLQV